MSYNITRTTDGGLTKTPDGYSGSIVYTVVCEGETPTHFGALAAVPAIGSVYPGSSASLRLQVKTQDIKQVENNHYVFTITNSYEQSRGDEPQGEISVDDDPLLRLPVVSFSVSTLSVPTDQDYEGNPIVNSARDAIDNLPTLELHQLEVKITKNMPQFKLKDWLPYFGKLNNADYTLPGGYQIPKHLGKIKHIIPIGEYDTGSSTYVKVEYSIVVSPFGWDYEFIDQGFSQYIVAEDENEIEQPTRLKILDANAQPVQKPALLDGTGAVMGSSGLEPGVGIPKGATSRQTDYATFLAYRTHQDMDFYDLLLTPRRV